MKLDGIPKQLLQVSQHTMVVVGLIWCPFAGTKSSYETMKPWLLSHCIAGIAC